MLIAYFDLNESDIQSLKLNDKIRIDNSWWNINKVIDYDCNASNLTKVELMSVDTEIDFAPFKTKIPTKPNVTEYIGITRDIIQRKIDGANTVAKGADVVIKGYGNVVNPDVKAVIIGDNMYITEDGVYTDKINSVAPSGDNFANADLVFDANRTHDLNGYSVFMSTDAGAFTESSFEMSTTNANLLFGTGGVLVTSEGTYIKKGVQYSVASANANYNLGVDNHILNCTANTFTVTLPTAVGRVGKEYTIKNSGSGVITLEGDGTETIDGALNQTLNQYDSITVVSDGTNWIII
jgi:hypothetical protein